MLRTLLTASTITCMLAFGIPSDSAALTGAAQSSISKVGTATKDLGKDVAKGTTEVAKKTGEVTQDAAKKTVTHTKNAGKTVQGAVTPGVGSTRCKDGTVQTGKTHKAACSKHGGVKP